eukprot:CAMPEP_0198470084 /NCGR_PEP_ID=MMETSP1456-20131121/15919_1 /TAXON_ID=1461544 ORGANISM="Unidentified sp., Strain RCC1871" /NCGR_SAMPLE_ID=MMETSP1456 /ASSEMBLY_ACC=CAM_ASM_001119 /LENGTH=89 /DNA_ID=CAMNT_0044196555 /DNA_START=30 /DNA_END=295 /DNA_ORIENTATION=+
MTPLSVQYLGGGAHKLEVEVERQGLQLAPQRPVARHTSRHHDLPQPRVSLSRPQDRGPRAQTEVSTATRWNEAAMSALTLALAASSPTS